MELWRQESFPPVTPKKKLQKKDKNKQKYLIWILGSLFGPFLGPFWYFENYKQVEFGIFPLDDVYDKSKTFNTQIMKKWHFFVSWRLWQM